MKEVVIQRLTGQLEAYSDLLVGMGQVDIEKKLDTTKNKNLAEHLWCVIGARERVIAKVLDPVVGMASFAL